MKILVIALAIVTLAIGACHGSPLSEIIGPVVASNNTTVTIDVSGVVVVFETGGQRVLPDGSRLVIPSTKIKIVLDEMYKRT
jgi:hypothetical protein